MSDNKNSFLYTKYLSLVDFISCTTFYLYNTMTNSTWYHFAKNKLFALKNRMYPKSTNVHVDSDNLFYNATNITKDDKPVAVDTDIKLDTE